VVYAPIGGFTAVDYGSPLLAVYAIPGTKVRLSLRKETAPLHVALAAAWSAEVEELLPGQCWGHAYRAVRGTTAYTSYHALGNAMDFNSLLHPLGVRGTFSARKVAAARRVLARFSHEGVRLYRWGNDYTGRVDGMHVELVAPRALALRAVAALQRPPVREFPLPAGHWFGVQDGDTAGAHAGTRPEDLPHIKAIQAKLNRLGNELVVDGKFGPATERVVRLFQSNRQMPADGKVGPATWSRLF
jgi:hypothetical protein